MRPIGPLGGFPLADVVPASVAALVAHPNGAVTPIETPSVAAARRDHLLAKDAAFAAAGPLLAATHALPTGPVAAPFPALAPTPAIAPYAGPLADRIPASVNGLVAHPNGAVTPVETPSVAAARQDHLHAKGSAYAAAAPILPQSLDLGSFPAVPGLGGVVPGVGPTGGLVAHPNGAVVPADEPAVVAARGEHLAHFA